MDCQTDVELNSLLIGSEYFSEVLLSSARLKKAYELARRVAPYNATVLINGESGTGKELIARTLHRLGPNPQGPFIALNSANLVGPLAESQLFGHVRGAFTDARENALGYSRSKAGRCFSMKSASCRWSCNRRFCARSKIARFRRSAHTNRRGWTCGWWRQLTAICGRWWRPNFREDLYYRLTRFR